MLQLAMPSAPKKNLPPKPRDVKQAHTWVLQTASFRQDNSSEGRLSQSEMAPFLIAAVKAGDIPVLEALLSSGGADPGLGEFSTRRYLCVQSGWLFKTSLAHSAPEPHKVAVETCLARHCAMQALPVDRVEFPTSPAAAALGMYVDDLDRLFGEPDQLPKFYNDVYKQWQEEAALRGAFGIGELLDMPIPEAVAKKQWYNVTPMYMAVNSENYAVMMQLFEGGASIQKHPLAKISLVYIAVQKQNLTMLHFLVRNGAQIDSGAQKLAQMIATATSQDGSEKSRNSLAIRDFLLAASAAPGFVASKQEEKAVRGVAAGGVGGSSVKETKKEDKQGGGDLAAKTAHLEQTFRIFRARRFRDANVFPTGRVVLPTELVTELQCLIEFQDQSVALEALIGEIMGYLRVTFEWPGLSQTNLSEFVIAQNMASAQHIMDDNFLNHKAQLALAKALQYLEQHHAPEKVTSEIRALLVQQGMRHEDSLDAFIQSVQINLLETAFADFQDAREIFRSASQLAASPLEFVTCFQAVAGVAGDATVKAARAFLKQELKVTDVDAYAQQLQKQAALDGLDLAVNHFNAIREANGDVGVASSELFTALARLHEYMEMYPHVRVDIEAHQAQHAGAQGNPNIGQILQYMQWGRHQAFPLFAQYVAGATPLPPVPKAVSGGAAAAYSVSSASAAPSPGPFSRAPVPASPATTPAAHFSSSGAGPAESKETAETLFEDLALAFWEYETYKEKRSEKTKRCMDILTKLLKLHEAGQIPQKLYQDNYLVIFECNKEFGLNLDMTQYSPPPGVGGGGGLGHG